MKKALALTLAAAMALSLVACSGGSGETTAADSSAASSALLPISGCLDACADVP